MYIRALPYFVVVALPCDGVIQRASELKARLVERSCSWHVFPRASVFRLVFYFVFFARSKIAECFGFVFFFVFGYRNIGFLFKKVVFHIKNTKKTQKHKHAKHEA